jgi:uncharacterized SAM-binding protein YcdF (DUF218 family)
MSAAPRLRTAARRAIVALVLATAAALTWFIVYGGRYLQREDPLQKVDAIFILGGSRLERPLEALDLYREGYSPIVILSPGRQPEPAERLVRTRGIVIPTDAELARDALIKLGIPAAAIMPTNGYVDNTAGEANLLRAMVRAHGWRRIMIVTSKYHTRRARFAFSRGLEGTGASAVVRATRYDESDPAHWWRSRPDVRFVLSEWQKLILYRLGLDE